MSVSVVPDFLLICSIYIASPVRCPFICETVFVWVSYFLMSSTFWKCCY